MPHNPNSFVRPIHLRLIVDIEPWQAELLERAFAALAARERIDYAAKVPVRLQGKSARYAIVDEVPRSILPPTAAMVHEERTPRAKGFDWKDANRNAHKRRHKRTR